MKKTFLYTVFLRISVSLLNVPLIDLAKLLPKCSEYFYDVVHFTNNGAKQAGLIIYDSLRHIIRH